MVSKNISLKLLILNLLIISTGSFLFPSSTYAQGGGNLAKQLSKRGDQFGTYDEQPMGVVDHNADTTKKEKEKIRKKRKPLQSYYFDDSIKARRFFAWRANQKTNNIQIIEIDTMLNNRFEQDYIFQRNGVGSAYLGNLGGPNVPLDFSERTNNKDFNFLNAYESYLINPSKVRHFNVRRPFTLLEFYMSGRRAKAEEQFNALHAQNISPSSGINVDYRNNGTNGMYARQKAKDKNLSLSYAYTGRKYSLHAGYIYNMGEIRENGGIVSDADIKDTLYEEPENIAVRLKDAKNKFKGNTFHLTHSYAIPFSGMDSSDMTVAKKSTLFLGHSFEYTNFRKIYTDSRKGTITGSGANAKEYYDNWYINKNNTSDSINESLLDNKFFVQMQPWNRNGLLGVFGGGVGYSMHNYYYFTPNQYLKPNDKGDTEQGLYVFGSAEGMLKKYLSWNGDATYYPVGYRNQDIKVNGNLTLSAYIKSKPISLNLNLLFERKSPSYWMQNYFSNHYRWNNNFSKENEQKADVSLKIDALNLEIGAWGSLVGNKIYYNFESMPTQRDGNVFVTGYYLNKDFIAGGLEFKNRVLIQNSSNDRVVPVPLLSYYGSISYEFIAVRDYDTQTNEVLRLQIGIDGFYNTRYYAFGYNPAIMQFYNQREKKTGQYPYMDAYVAAKWKRMRILVKVQHVNYDIFGDRNYFSIVHYPLNRRMLKLGFSWPFYN